MIPEKSTAVIHEIFSSVQGEGTLIGSWQIFVRFRGCGLQCKNCDTRESWDVTDTPCTIRRDFRYNNSTLESNPLSIDRLNRIIRDIDQPEKFHRHLVLTGGEPLEQSVFLMQWLPSISDTFPIMLETNAIHFERVNRIRDHVHFVSMDYKLSSFTGIEVPVNQHLEFYKIMQNVPGNIKIVVTPETTDDEISQATEIIHMSQNDKPVIIQPSREYRQQPGILERLRTLSLILNKHLADVRIISQMHPDWRIP
jgi:organic radical activating enzyme